MNQQAPKMMIQKHIKRLNIDFTKESATEFLLSTRFLFQNLDRVTIFDNKFNLIGDTDTLDLDTRSFEQTSEVIQMDSLNDKSVENKNNQSEKNIAVLSRMLSRWTTFAELVLALMAELGSPRCVLSSGIPSVRTMTASAETFHWAMARALSPRAL